MATVAALKLKALYKLGVIRVGQSAQPKDSTQVQESYNEVYAVLKKLSLATWTSTGTIPEEVVPHVVALVAFNRIDEFSVSNARYQRIQLSAGVAIAGIRTLVNPDYEALDDPVDY